MQTNACNCGGWRKTMAARLAKAFGTEPWVLMAELNLTEVASWLSITPKKVEVLVGSGLLRAVDQRVRLEDLVAFARESGWLQLRADVHLRILEEELAALDARETERNLTDRSCDVEIDL